MRACLAKRALAVGTAAICALSACGNGSPTTPDMPSVVIATGPQVLRITFQGSCNTPDGRPFLPLVYARVVVTRSGSDWVAASAAPDADVELRFHATGSAAVVGSMPVAGTIKGTATHSSELLPAGPPSTTRIFFGTDARTTVSGFAFSPSALSPASGVSGIGGGSAITLSDLEGRSCAGSAFSWGLGSMP